MSAKKQFNNLILQIALFSLKKVSFTFFLAFEALLHHQYNNSSFFRIKNSFSRKKIIISFSIFLIHPFATILCSTKTWNFTILFKFKFVIITKFFTTNDSLISKNNNMEVTIDLDGLSETVGIT